jgi:hypothetical protein
MWAGRCLQLKGAKVVTGARQTGVKDRNFEASTERFWRKRAFHRGFLHKPGQSFQVLREAAENDGPDVPFKAASLT